MSDYYGFPNPTPPGVYSPNVMSLYQQAQPFMNNLPGSIPSGVMAPDVAGLYGGAVPGSAAVGASGVSSGPGALSSMLSRTGGLFAGDSSPIISGGLRGAARVAVPFGIGQLATAGINSALPPSDAREVLGDAATGAGIGGSVGLLGGPFAGISVPAGAAIGGAAGGLYGLAQNIWGSDDSKPSTDDYKTTLAQAAQQSGLDPSMYTTAFDLLTKSGADPKTLAPQLAQQLLRDAASQRQQAKAQQLAIQQHTNDQHYALAMQAQAQQFFTPYVDNIITAGQSQAELLKGEAANLPAPYRNVFLAQAEQAISQSQRLAGAYAAQSAMLPSQYMMSQDLKRQQELAQLQYQQAVINSQQGGSGSGNFGQLVSQLQSQQAAPTG